MSILSAVEDKVRRRLREDISQNQAEVDSLKKVQEEFYRVKMTETEEQFVEDQASRNRSSWTISGAVSGAHTP